MNIRFLDLRVTDTDERTAILAAVGRVLDHGRLVMGPEMEQFETAIAAQCGRRHAVAVGSGTHALWLALKVLRLHPGDEVITTSLSWIATANAVALAGGTPVFADIGDDLNIDPASVRRLITSRTRAIVPVHYTGRICQMEELGNIAREYQIPIIEDAAQAFGATLDGRPAGSFGYMAAFSMNPMKVLAGCGEAGAVVTDDPTVYERLVSLRYNGCVNREVCIEPALNGRIDTVEAAILLERLKRLPTLLAARRNHARQYDALIRDLVRPPARSSERDDVYYTYTIQAERRDELRDYLAERGVETKIQHVCLMPDQPAYQALARSECARARQLRERILCLPIHEKLTAAEIVYVSQCIRGFYAAAGSEAIAV